MDVRDAIKKATEAAKQYAGADVSIRVEEVEAKADGWEIALSWLVLDEAAQMARNVSQTHRMNKMLSIFTEEPPLLERVYHRFIVEEKEPVRMKRL